MWWNRMNPAATSSPSIVLPPFKLTTLLLQALLLEQSRPSAPRPWTCDTSGYKTVKTKTCFASTGTKVPPTRQTFSPSITQLPTKTTCALSIILVTPTIHPKPSTLLSDTTESSSHCVQGCVDPRLDPVTCATHCNASLLFSHCSVTPPISQQSYYHVSTGEGQKNPHILPRVSALHPRVIAQGGIQEDPCFDRCNEFKTLGIWVFDIGVYGRIIGVW